LSKTKYTKDEFMKLAGINNRQRLDQLMNGYKNIKNGKEYKFEPVLIEGKDFVKSEIVFFESALKKIKGK
jgi:hypothetical protein